jgi:hypothetical protein
LGIPRYQASKAEAAHAQVVPVTAGAGLKQGAAHG